MQLMAGVIFGIFSACVNAELKSNTLTEYQGEVLYFHRGKEYALCRESPSFSKIIGLAIKAIETSDDLYRKVLTKQIIKEARREGGVEILFREPILLSMGAYGPRSERKRSHIKKILIPCSSRKKVDIFFGDPEYAQLNIVVNSDPAIREELHNLFNDTLANYKGNKKKQN